MRQFRLIGLPNNMHEKDDQLSRQSSSNNMAQSFSETDSDNDKSSPMPAKKQMLNEKEVLLKHRTFSI